MTGKLNAIGFAVADMAATVEFYRRLGVDFGDEGEHREADLGGVRLMIDTYDVMRSFMPDFEPPTGPGRVSFAVQFDSPADVDAAYAELTGAGHAGELEPFDAPWGQRYATVADPDGNPVDLYAAMPSTQG